MAQEVREPSARYLVRAAFRPTVVGPIPADWQLTHLTEVAEVRGGIAKNSNTPIAEPMSVAYLRVANVQDGYLDLAELSTIAINKQDLKRYLVLPGDVLMNEGGDLDKLGRGAIWTGQVSPCVHQNHVFVVRCKPSLLPAYLNIWTSTFAARRYFLLAGKQTTNLASISKTSLGELPVAVPSAEEQRAIATALSDIDALLTGLDRLIAKKRDLKRAAMQKLLTGQTRLPGFQGEWQTTAFADVVTTPITDGPHSTPNFLQIGVPFLSVNNLINNRLDFDSPRFISSADHVEFSKKCKPRRGDILFGKAASVGMVALVDSDAEFNIWSPLALIRVTGKMSEQFAFYALQGSGIARQIKLLTNASSQGNIGMSDIGLLRIPKPALNEQEAIATILSDMDAELTALEARRDKTRALKLGMMQELLTGRTRLV